MTKKDTQTQVEKVTAEFLAEIQERGLPHVLEWISSWYTKVAKAKLQDDFAGIEGRATSAAWKEIQTAELLMYDARSGFNYSTSPGANLMRQARISVLADMLDHSRGEAGFGAVARRNRADKLRALDEAAAKENPKK
ncbi:hypothetical protein LC612_36140 [Nostoc sp. CHAB 5834]|nr:hypothetical protein [Nostoc sp. CHAB 5834]